MTEYIVKSYFEKKVAICVSKIQKIANVITRDQLS